MSIISNNYAALGNRLIVGSQASDSEQPVRVEFAQSKNGYIVPRLVYGTTFSSLHSLYDPIKETEKLCTAASCERGMYIFLGLGLAYHINYLFQTGMITNAIIIEHNRTVFEAILHEVDLSSLLANTNILVLLDCEQEKIAAIIKDTFNPYIDRRCRVFSLTGRVHSFDAAYFTNCTSVIERALQDVASDLSAQAAFGIPWLRNILHNLRLHYQSKQPFTLKRKHVLIIAAGPGLETKIDTIKLKAPDCWILAVDTSLGCLLAYDIIPDAVISIDCQYISTNHFLHELPATTMIFLDIAAHPAISAKLENIFFIGSKHPLVTTLCNIADPFPQLDFSGGNVTFAACELANYLGAETIEIFGADYAYVKGKVYANNTYLQSLFLAKDTRSKPVSTLYAELLFRNSALRRINHDDGSITYKTALLDRYHQFFQERRSLYNAAIIDTSTASFQTLKNQSSTSKANMLYQKPIDTSVFLEHYKTSLLAAKNALRRFLENSNVASQPDFALLQTLYPIFAHILKRSPAISTEDLLETALAIVLREIAK